MKRFKEGAVKCPDCLGLLNSAGLRWYCRACEVYWIETEDSERLKFSEGIRRVSESRVVRQESSVDGVISDLQSLRQSMIAERQKLVGKIRRLKNLYNDPPDCPCGHLHSDHRTPNYDGTFQYEYFQFCECTKYTVAVREVLPEIILGRRRDAEVEGPRTPPKAAEIEINIRVPSSMSVEDLAEEILKSLKRDIEREKV